MPKFGAGCIASALVALATLCACSMNLSPTAPNVVPPQSAGEFTETKLWASLTRDAGEALKRGDTAAAERLYKEAIKIARVHGESCPTYASSLSNIADFYYAQGDGDEADRLYKQSLQLKRKYLGAGRLEVAKDLSGLGAVALKNGKLSEAEKYYAEALAVREKQMHEHDPVLIETMKMYDEVLRSESKMEEARRVEDKIKIAERPDDMMESRAPDSVTNSASGARP